MKKIPPSFLRFSAISVLVAGLISNCNAIGSSDGDNPSANLGLGLLALAQSQTTAPLPVRSTSELAWESNDDYNQNQFGLITTATLERWVSDWNANRPIGISGKLVILQNGDVAGGVGVIQGNGQNVVGYSFDLANATDSFLQTRNNGVVDTVSIIPDGPRMDQVLNRYGIDPVNDLIVLASSANNENHYMTTLRAFYSLYYWGVDKRNLAVLNGTLANSGIRGNLRFGSIGNIPPNLQNRYSVRQLRVDNTILQLSLEETKQAVSNPTNHGISTLSGRIFVGDARSAGEYAGTASAGGSYHPVTAPNAVSPAQADTRYLGTLKGAIHTPWQVLLNDSASGFTFKTKSELKTYYEGKGFQSGQTIIQLCKTNYRAQITGFATLGILGYPTTYYDGGWVEWGNLISGGDNPTLPTNSAYKTDLDSVTDNGRYNAAANTTISPNGLNIRATTSKKIILDDKAYKF